MRAHLHQIAEARVSFPHLNLVMLILRRFKMEKRKLAVYFWLMPGGETVKCRYRKKRT